MLPHIYQETNDGEFGLFATQDIVHEESVPFYLFGAFEVLTQEGWTSSVNEDGVPRFIVCDHQLLSSLLDSGEVVKEGALLFLKPDPACFLFYMSSCFPTDEKESMSKNPVFADKSPTAQTARPMLRDACNGVEFNLKQSVKKGDELLCYYPIVRGRAASNNKSGDGGTTRPRGGGVISGGDGGGSSEGPPVTSPSRRSSRRRPNLPEEGDAP